MVRLLVVDDEKIVLDSVTYMISSSFENILVETARNGKEGLVKLDSFKPHILMTDIRMPGISGLELIKKARLTDNAVKILIVTAFEEFEYAREAFKYDVEDYILKPLGKKKLVESLNKTLQKIESEQARRDEELESIEKYYASISLVESNFFQSIMLNRDLSKALHQYRDLLTIGLEEGYMLAIEFRTLEDDAPPDQVTTWTMRLGDSCDYLKGHVKYHYDAIVSNVVFNRIFVYMEASEGKIHEEALMFWTNIHDSLLKKFGLKARIVVGPVRPITAVAESFEECLVLLNTADANVTLWRESPQGNYDPAVFRQVSGRIHEQFQTRSRKVMETFQELKEVYFSMARGQNGAEAAESLLLELLILLVNQCRTNGCTLNGELAGTGYMKTYGLKTTFGKIAWFEEILNGMLEENIRLGTGNCTELVQGTLDRLKDGYAQEIGLEEIAQTLGVTPQYLSKIFRQETGRTFKEHLIDLRISEARRLLRETPLSAREISYAVGYNDPNYFVRLFKKITGLTPKEYQRVME